MHGGRHAGDMAAFLALKSQFISRNSLLLVTGKSISNEALSPTRWQYQSQLPSISCCVLNHHNLFYQIQNALAFNRDACCHLVLCLRLLPFHGKKTLAYFCQFFCKKLVFFKHERDSHARSYERDWMKWNGMITRLKGQDNFRKSPLMTSHVWQMRMINLAHEWQTRMRNLAHERQMRTRNLAHEWQTRMRNLAHEWQTRTRNLAHEWQTRMRNLAHERQTRIRNLAHERQTRMRNLAHERQTRMRNLAHERQTRMRNLAHA
jgi:hypothetical protein